jgi:4'-phosphopantetheinyl transferase
VCGTRFFFVVLFLFLFVSPPRGWLRLHIPLRSLWATANAPSLEHPQLTTLEISFLNLDLGEEVVLRRLCILLALKAAYIKAIGQPIGFDWSRLEFNISEETCSGDGQPLTGWEFRLYKAHLGVQRRGVLHEESYQCVTAHFRGTPDSKFVWQDSNKDLESWVQFINIDQMTNVIPKLTD